MFRVYGTPVERQPSACARASQALFFSGVVLGALGPTIAYGLAFLLSSHIEEQLVYGGVFWLWTILLPAGGAIGYWGWRRSNGDDDASRRYGILNWMALAVIALLYFLILAP